MSFPCVSVVIILLSAVRNRSDLTRLHGANLLFMIKVDLKTQAEFKSELFI